MAPGTFKLLKGHRKLFKCNLLLILTVGILNSIIGCQAMPKPQNIHNDNFGSNFAAEMGAPLITPLMEYVILEKDSNYSLRCEANEPIEWRVDNSESSFESKSFDTLDPERPFGQILYLKDISYTYVGAYYCIKKSSLKNKKPIEDLEEEELSELVNNNEASTIYLYVNDKENLLVPMKYPIAYAQQYEDTTIPCKPTMPDGIVLLVTPGGETFSSENTGRYDPQRGFVVEIRAYTDSGTYTCLPKVPSPVNEEESTEMDIKFVGNAYINPNARASPTEKLKRASSPTIPADNANDSKSNSTVTNHLNVANRINTHKANAFRGALVIANKAKRMLAVGNIDVVSAEGGGGGGGVGGSDVGGDLGSGKETIFESSTPDLFASSTTDKNDLDGEAFSSSTIDYDSTTNGLSSEYADDLNESEESDSIEVNGTASSMDLLSPLHLTYDLKTLPKKRALSTTVPPSRRPYHLRHSTPRPSTKYINRPQIKSESDGHAYVGSTFHLNCEVIIAHDVRFKTEWITPQGVDKSRIIEQETKFKNHTVTHNQGSSVLTITNAQKTDSGPYKCIVTDHSKNQAHTTYSMTILDPNQSYINMSEPNNYYLIKSNASKTIQMTVQYRGFPKPTLTWHRPDGSQILPTKMFSVDTTASSSTLRISDAQMLDSGDYVVRATNGIIQKELKFEVKISDVPNATVENVYVQAGEEAHVVCKVVSVPPAVVSWLFTPCSIAPRWPNCERKYQQSFNSTRSAQPGNSSIELIHDIYFTPKSPGEIHCVATNVIGSKHGTAQVLVGDLTDKMAVYGVDEHRKIARGDEVVITCAALAYYFTGNLTWYKDGEEVESSSNIALDSNTSDFSYKNILKFKSVQDHDRGSYECRAVDIYDHTRTESKFISIFVHEPAVPVMTYTNLDNSKFERKLGDSLELECKSDAIPRANVDWFKDDKQLYANEDIAIEEDNTKLIIRYIKPENEGTYKCIVSNRLGTLESSASMLITNMPNVNKLWIVGALVFVLILVLIVIFLFARVKRSDKQLRELKAAGLVNFEEGAIEHINPALTLDEQADLLPYNPAFEFPRDKLKLGKQLGAGAFGVVLKAYAEGIKPNERESVVAVKMVKRTADNEVMRALVSELKIMVHLGQHLNVVNLLGAVTKNIVKRELMVIVEYCRYGNVQNFLLRNRKRFINQISLETDKIDPTIMTQRFSDNFEFNRGGLKYVNLSFNIHQYSNHMSNKNNNYTVNHRRNSDNDPRSGTRAGRPNSKGYVRRPDSYEGPVNSCATEQTVMTTIPDEEQILSNNSVQPAWRSNYKPDSTEAMTITTTDLVSWAFQVARGMDYLSSQKVLHGDLAARNILLCEDNVVKICDFGLARSMYKNDNYKKQGEAPLPIKWLALESLSDHVFSTYTDVWSYGIVLWEFFSLAKVPYPGMDPNQSLFLKLKDGYRMEKPQFANDELYDIMLECWSTNPESRPRFHVLEKRFAQMLGEDVTNHYLDLNEPYLRANAEYRKHTPTDYLALMGSPDEMAPSPPRYVNGHILPEIRIEPSPDDDYLQMSTNSGTAIFSPTRPKEQDSESNNDPTAMSSFTFPDVEQQNSPTLAKNMDSPVNKNRRKDVVQPEEIPMLHSTHHVSGSEGEDSPKQSRRFANILQQTRVTPTPSPRHHVETQLNGSNHDDYVNVKSPKKQTLGGNGITVDAYSNPSYQPLKTASGGGGSSHK